MDRIEIFERARDDADEACAYLATKVSPDFAVKWYQGLFEQIGTLKELPARRPVAAESGKLATEVRELIHGKRRHKHKYRILFSIGDDLVSILAVQHSSGESLSREVQGVPHHVGSRRRQSLVRRRWCLMTRIRISSASRR